MVERPAAPGGSLPVAAEARTQEMRGKGTLLIDWSGALTAMTGLGKREHPD